MQYSLETWQGGKVARYLWLQQQQHTSILPLHYLTSHIRAPIDVHCGLYCTSIYLYFQKETFSSVRLHMNHGMLHSMSCMELLSLKILET